MGWTWTNYTQNLYKTDDIGYEGIFLLNRKSIYNRIDLHLKLLVAFYVNIFRKINDNDRPNASELSALTISVLRFVSLSAV